MLSGDHQRLGQRRRQPRRFIGRYVPFAFLLEQLQLLQEDRFDG